MANLALREWKRPIHAAGMDRVTYRTGFANAAVAMEHQAVRRDFPGFKRMPALQGCGVWRGQLRPIAQTYDVRVDMALGCADANLSFPRRVGSVRVLGGAVRPAPDGSPVPHLYSAWDDPKGADLCLYYPADETMVPGQQVAQKLLPWAYEWLYYYEMWLVTGFWAGPEAPHDLGDAAGAVLPPEGDVQFGSRLRDIDDPVMRGMSYIVDREHPVRCAQSALAA
jgi:hypothetical protein